MGVWRSSGVAAGLAVVMVAAGACGGGGARKTNTFSVAITEPDHLTPGRTTSAYSIQVDESLFDNLMTINPKTNKPQKVEAQSLTSPDEKTWTIKLKPGLKFANGEPVTAHSYVDAWNAAAYAPNGWAANYYFANIKGYDALNPKKGKPKKKTLSGLKVIDNRTFKVTLTAPFSQFPTSLAFNGFAPLPKVAFKNLQAFDNKPVGNGPYEMSGKWQHNVAVKVKKNPKYTGPRKGHADKVTFKSYASTDSAYTDLQAGKVDTLSTVPASKVSDAKKTFGDRFRGVPSGSMDYLGFPLYDKRFDNVNLRRAISMAINRKAIVNAVYNGTYKPMGSLFPPIVPGYKKNACGKYCTYNPKLAKKLFRKAGGFKGNMNLWFANSDPTYGQWMQSVANQLKQNLGINAKFRKVAAADYLNTLSNHKVDGPYRQNWQMDYPSAQDYLETQWGSDNRMAWKGKDYDQFNKLISQANGAKNQNKSVRLYQQAQGIALKDMPMTPLWNWEDQSAWSDAITNVVEDTYVGFHVEDIKVKTS